MLFETRAKLEQWIQLIANQSTTQFYVEEYAIIDIIEGIYF